MFNNLKDHILAAVIGVMVAFAIAFVLFSVKVSFAEEYHISPIDQIRGYDKELQIENFGKDAVYKYDGYYMKVSFEEGEYEPTKQTKG